MRRRKKEEEEEEEEEKNRKRRNKKKKKGGGWRRRGRKRRRNIGLLFNVTTISCQFLSAHFSYPHSLLSYHPHAQHRSPNNSCQMKQGSCRKPSNKTTIITL